MDVFAGALTRCLSSKGWTSTAKIKRKAKKMKRYFLMAAILFSLMMNSSMVAAKDQPQIILIPRESETYAALDFMLIREVGVMRDMLQKAGFKVVVATTSGQLLEGFIKNLKPDLKLSEVRVDDYAGVILACMAVGFFPGVPISPAAVSVVKQAVAKGIPVAANGGAIYILAEAGTLKGRRYSFTQDLFNPYSPHKRDPRFEGAIYNGHGIVQDGLIITSAICPVQEHATGLRDGTSELIRVFISILGRKSRN
jgi:putative intracellular protease/amidase